MAFTYRSKIRKEKGVKTTPLEEQIAQHLFEYETNADAESKTELAKLHIVAAKEVDVGKGKSAVVVFVPYRELRQYRKQGTLVKDLERRQGKHVVVIAQRRILRTPSKTNTVKLQKRPRSRTLTAVHDAILDDLVYPAEIVDKRIRQRVDGSRSYRVTLESKEDVEDKLDTFSGVYLKLTGKHANFILPASVEQ